MIDWKRKIEEYRMVSLHPSFLDARFNAESEARELLKCKVGRFNREDLKVFLKLCNTELTHNNFHNLKHTYKRFGLAFISNRGTLIANTGGCNRLFSDLWQFDGNELDILDSFWRHSHITGAGTGLPTLILYLKHPEKYNIWFPYLSDGISSIIDKKLDKSINIINYTEYNNKVNNHLKNIKYSPPIKPQEIDYILYRIGKENH